MLPGSLSSPTVSSRGFPGPLFRAAQAVADSTFHRDSGSSLCVFVCEKCDLRSLSFSLALSLTVFRRATLVKKIQHILVIHTRNYTHSHSHPHALTPAESL